MVEIEYTKSGVPKACSGCGHPFHSAGNCRGLQAGRCPCEHNMAVLLDISDQPQQHGVGGVDTTELRATIYKQSVALQAVMAEGIRLRARCASLEAVAEAAKGIALRQSPTHQALRQALTALDQDATTTHVVTGTDWQGAVTNELADSFVQAIRNRIPGDATLEVVSKPFDGVHEIRVRLRLAAVVPVSDDVYDKRTVGETAELVADLLRESMRAVLAQKLAEFS